MGYADRRRVSSFKVGASINDDTVIGYMIVPAGKEIEIYGLKSVTVTKSPTANAKIELINGSTVLASVAITQNNGTVSKDSTTTFPVRVTNTGASDAVLKIQTDQATGTGCDVQVEVHHSDAGV